VASAWWFVLAAGTTRADVPTAPELAQRIDRILASRWQEAGVQPAETADDATFVRRAYLALAGKIPTVAQAERFLADKSEGKRRALVDELLASRAHARSYATFWRRTWIPQADTPQFARLAGDFEAWLAKRLYENAPYDELVRQALLASPNSVGEAGGPNGFLAAGEFKPENLAANTSRAFLGLNLDCAQCHNHPFSRWTRAQFWQTAAFFTRPATDDEGAVRFEIAIPETETVVPAAFLTGEQVKWPQQGAAESGRRELAEWIVAPQNPYFARNAVNRLWAQLFGEGLVEPLDDLGEGNPPVDRELLGELTRAFVESRFDMRYLTEAIILSRAWQLKAGGAAGSSAAEALFSFMPARGLTGEQLYDSLRLAAGLPFERDDLDAARAAENRQRFVAVFRADRAAAAERSIPQALSLMNGRLMAELTGPKSPILVAAADAPFLDDAGRVRTLFLAALSRLPSDEERATMVDYVRRGGADGETRHALADVWWALLNSHEFNTNH
jgi:hypothetical protein